MTDLNRWKELSSSKSPPSWNDRTVAMSGLIPEGASVMDVGCGNRHLKSMLNKKSKYTGIDCVKGHKSTIVIDFNSDNLETISLPMHDIVFCSGILEYIDNPEKFIMFCKRHGKHILLSYILADNRFKKTEHLNGWMNSFNMYDMQELFLKCGLVVADTTKHKNHTIFQLIPN